MGRETLLPPHFQFLLTVLLSFQWVSRRLDVLRGNILDLILNAPEKLGTSLEETFGRRLQDIPEEKYHHALLLFQCLVAAIRPLRIDELAEIFSAELGLNMTYNEEDAVLSACPLITVVDERDPKIVQFSPPSMKDFLTSDRLQTSYPGDISRYHVSPEVAHAILSRACINTLLRLDKSVVQTDLERFPLAFYAAQHWVDHTQFGDVASRNQDFMERLFDPKKPHLEAWIWIHDIEKGQKQTIGTLSPRPSTRSASPLYYAALCGLRRLVGRLANMYREDLNDKRGYHGTPLHVASYMGHLETARALIAAGADVNITNGSNTPLHAAFYGGRLEVMRLLLRHGADVDAKDTLQNTLLHQASLDGQLPVVDLLLEYNADTEASNRKGWTPLHRAALCGQFEVTRRLLAKGAVVNTQTLDKNTPLHVGSIAGRFQVVKLLLEHEADVHIRGEHSWTPLEAARANGHHKIVELLSKSGDESRRFRLHKRGITVRKRRALLVGITYSAPFNKWSSLEGPHHDVDHFRELLISA
jgi:ankyrin repeat protein